MFLFYFMHEIIKTKYTITLYPMYTYAPPPPSEKKMKNNIIIYALVEKLLFNKIDM